MESNYEKQAVAARELFVKYNQELIIQKYGLKHDETAIYLDFLGQTYKIGRKSGEVWQIRTAREYSGNQEDKTFELCRDYQVVMTIYDMLCYSKETPILSGEWCPLASLQVTMSSPSADTYTRKYAEYFTGKTKKLREVCQKLGGIPTAIHAGADVSIQIPAFKAFPVIFRYWDRDEEFDPKIQLLWNKNSLQFMHFETLYYLMNHLLKRLAEELESLIPLSETAG